MINRDSQKGDKIGQLQQGDSLFIACETRGRKRKDAEHEACGTMCYWLHEITGLMSHNELCLQSSSFQEGSGNLKGWEERLQVMVGKKLGTPLQLC